MRHLSRIAVVAAMIAASVSCGDVVRDGKSPMFLGIDSLTPSPLLADVQKLVTTGVGCTTDNPCATITDDIATVTLRTPLKNVTNPSSPNAPTTNNEVTLNRYHVTFTRTDGRNTPGVDVPFAFDGGISGTIPLGGTLTVSFEVVRHIAKAEAPLVQLVRSPSIIYTIAEVTFFGRDRVGNDISATGSMEVNFGNFADTP